MMIEQEFSYELLDKMTCIRTREHADQIRQLSASISNNLIEIGLRLIEVHGLLGRDFNSWVKHEFSWSQSYASKMENAAKKFADLESEVIGRIDSCSLTIMTRKKTNPVVISKVISKAKSGATVRRSEVLQLIKKYPDLGSTDTTVENTATYEMPEQIEPGEQDYKAVLRWFVEQFEGASGAGANHWGQFPEFRQALRLIGRAEDAKLLEEQN